MRYKLLILFLTLSCFSISAQPDLNFNAWYDSITPEQQAKVDTAMQVAQDFTPKFEQIIQKIVNEDYSPFSLIKDMNAEDIPDRFVPLLKQYETMPDSRVQRYIYKSYLEYGMASTDILFKKQMIANLLNACSCPDSIELSYACRPSIEFLIYFDNTLFDKTVIDTINERIRKNNRFSQDYAYLSGRLYQYQMIPVFENLLNKETSYEAKYRWHIILARLGNKQSINMVIEHLQKMYTEDRLWRGEKTFVYVKQKPVIDILFNDLLSNEEGTPYHEQWMKEPPADPPLAYGTLPILSKLVKDFPVEYRERGISGYTEEELEIARTWIKKHRKDYEIIKD